MPAIHLLEIKKTVSSFEKICLILYETSIRAEKKGKRKENEINIFVKCYENI